MAVELYPASAHDVFHGANVHYPREVDEAVQQIHGACKGLGTDEETLIAVLGSKSPETRNLISLRYKELYQQPLKSLLKSETSGDFGRLLRMISTPLAETEAQILRDATKGMGTTESLIVQILSGRTNEEMNILRRTYFDIVGKDLAVTLNSELSGDFRKVVMAVLQSSQEPYNPAVHNAAKAEEEAVALYKAGQGRLGTNEEVFIGILVKAPPEFLKMMDAVYVAKYNNNIAKAVDKEFSGDAKKSLNYLVRSTLDPYPAIAEVFEKTMKGFGTDETGLSTALVRYQSVLPYVKAVYKRLYHEELRDRISGETSGDYKKLLLEVFDAPQDPPKPKSKGPSGVVSSSGLSAAPTGANSPAYLSTQTSYAASSASLQAPLFKQPMAPFRIIRQLLSLVDIRRRHRHLSPRVIRVEAATLAKAQLKAKRQITQHLAIRLLSSNMHLGNNHRTNNTQLLRVRVSRTSSTAVNNTSLQANRINSTQLLGVRVSRTSSMAANNTSLQANRTNSTQLLVANRQANRTSSIQFPDSNRNSQRSSNNLVTLHISSHPASKRRLNRINSTQCNRRLNQVNIQCHNNLVTLSSRTSSTDSQATKLLMELRLPNSMVATHRINRSMVYKPSQFIFALFVAILLESTCAIGYEWEPEADVEIPGKSAVHPPNGLRRVQATTDLSSTGSISSASSAAAMDASASAATSATDAETPTTIMVLLPDNLAASYSGSGSVMFYDGSVGHDSKSESKSAGSDTVGDEASSSATGRNFGIASALTAFTVLFALAMA
ncbi:hypothetical protein JG687_00003556 [Phytophthora cactorum]|uniref:Annexin n=1 Tax=Phytophthora cactorum TaxID=29920 RepID=A0A8T1UTQ7_9STRA|nr:hypothetical protein JG687_00003556 [Phytophthora cactorum]